MIEVAYRHRRSPRLLPLPRFGFAFDIDQGSAGLKALCERLERVFAMISLTDLTPNFRHVRLLRAREKTKPAGEPDEGYDLLVPLDASGYLHAEDWRTHRAFCRVRRFARGGEERVGLLQHTPDGQWFFDYEAGEDDDEIGFRLGEEQLVTGEYVSIWHDDAMRTYQVARVERP